MQYKTFTLPNKTRAILVPMKDSKTVTVLVLVKTGALYESKEQNGLSHFLEHMCFKGTEKRPDPKTIVQELDMIGANYNAFTDFDYTGYYATAYAGVYNLIVDVISDIYLHSTFPEAELEKEKGVIKQEIMMYRDLPQARVDDVWREMLYGDTPAGRNIAGTPDTVSEFSRKDFKSYHDMHYNGANTVVIVAGSIDEEKVKEDITKMFSKVSEGTKTEHVEMSESQTVPMVRVENKETDQTHLVLGLRALKRFDPRMPALKVLMYVLDGGMSARLFQKMREDLGICYYVRAGIEAQKTHGTFSISAGVDNDRVKVAIEALLEELKKVRDTKISDEELERTKKHVIGGTYTNLETSQAWASFYGMREIADLGIKTPEEFEEEINKVTADDILAIAKEIIVDKNLNLAIVGRVSEDELRPILHL